MVYETKLTWSIAAAGHAEDVKTLQVSSTQGHIPKSKIFRLVYVAFDSSNNVTRTINVYNPAGVLVYTLSGIADAATRIITEEGTLGHALSIPFGDGYKVGMDLSGDAGNTGTDTLYIYSEC